MIGKGILASPASAYDADDRLVVHMNYLLFLRFNLKMETIFV
jgi:hypothetical protein